MKKEDRKTFVVQETEEYYQLYMWDEFELSWLRYQAHFKFKSVEDCEAEIDDYNTYAAGKRDETPRSDWKIVKVTVNYEEVK